MNQWVISGFSPESTSESNIEPSTESIPASSAEALCRVHLSLLIQWLLGCSAGIFFFQFFPNSRNETVGFFKRSKESHSRASQGLAAPGVKSDVNFIVFYLRKLVCFGSGGQNSRENYCVSWLGASNSRENSCFSRLRAWNSWDM